MKQVFKLKLYTPHEAQLAFHQCNKRFRVCSWGRQAGKSTGSLNDLAAKAWEAKNAIYWFIAPTWSQALVQFRRIEKLIPPEAILDIHRGELRIMLLSGTVIVFKSGQIIDNLRSETLDGVVIDEVRDQNKDLWPLVIRPMLMTTGGWATFISTPNGYDQFFDLAEEARKDVTGEWAFMKAPSSCNPLITQGEIDSMRLNMSEKQFQQEVLAEFVHMTTGKAYYSFSAANIVQSNPFCSAGQEWSPHLPIGVGMDFNVNPISWTLGQHKVKDFYWGREIVLPESNTTEAADVLASIVKGHKPGIVVIGDSSGSARSTASASKTDYDIIADVMRRNNIRCEIKSPESNPLVKDRVNIMNVNFKDGDGKPHIFVNRAGCPTLIRDFERVLLKPNAAGNFALDKATDMSLTHSSDGVGYFVYAIAGNQFDRRPSGVKVLYR